MTAPATVLRLTSVVKAFPGVVALREVSFDVVEGEVHALVGENGAGKSTLMAVAAGSTLPDAGTVEIGGHVMDPPSPSTAQALGLAVVYQHTSILEDLTVTENMVFAMPAALRPRRGQVGRWTRERLAVVGAQIDPEARVTELSAAQRQLVEIAKALALDAKVLILDEPTESLTMAESEILFARIRDITHAGKAVVYISHRLPEALRIADRMTVLRDGKVRATFPIMGVSTENILRLIIGRSVSQVFPEKREGQPAGDEALLRVSGLTGSRFHDVSLTVARGEIVGLAGVEGNGQREFLRALAGMQPSRGEIQLDDKPVGRGDPTRSHRAGMIHVPGDRHREGVFLSLSVRENIGLLALRRASRFGFVRRVLERGVIQPQVEQLAIRTPSLETPAWTLSGGNQQKVMLARSLLSEPRVLLADEPTSGVDVGTRVEVYRILRTAAEGGQGVVVVSSDALELQGLCDRVLVFSRGEVVRELVGEEISEANITGAAVTAQRGGESVSQRARQLLRLRRFAAGDYAPALVLGVLTAILAVYTGSQNDAFLSERALRTLMTLTSALVFVSIGQLMVLLVGGLDLSVGALMGLVVITLSSMIPEGAGPATILLGVGAALGVGIVVGLANGLLVRKALLAPVLATLAAGIVMEGVSLYLRPQPSGPIAEGFLDLVKMSAGPVPFMFIVAVGLVVTGEVWLRRTRPGIELRAVGSDPERARKLGARVNRIQIVAYIGCAVCTVLAGIVLASIVQIGQAPLGATYTLASVTAVVLGGASIFGGRGSFVGALAGAVLLQTIVQSTSFLDFGRAWQFWLPGLLILVAAAAYSRARRADRTTTA